MRAPFAGTSPQPLRAPSTRWSATSVAARSRRYCEEPDWREGPLTAALAIGAGAAAGDDHGRRPAAAPEPVSEELSRGAQQCCVRPFNEHPPGTKRVSR